MKKLSSLQLELEGWNSLVQRISDASELAQMEDESLRSDLEQEIEALETEISKL